MGWSRAMRIIIPAAALSLVLLTAVPAGAQSSFDASGMGCGQFLRARAGDAVYRQAANWLNGYANGLAAGLRTTRSAAVPAPTADQVLKSAIDYCQANPGATIANAAS